MLVHEGHPLQRRAEQNRAAELQTGLQRAQQHILDLKEQHDLDLGASKRDQAASCVHTAVLWKPSLYNSGKLLPRCMLLSTLLHSGQRPKQKSSMGHLMQCKQWCICQLSLQVKIWSCP